MGIAAFCILIYVACIVMGLIFMRGAAKLSEQSDAAEKDSRHVG